MCLKATAYSLHRARRNQPKKAKSWSRGEGVRNTQVAFQDLFILYHLRRNGKEYHQFRKMKRLSPHYPRQVYWAVLIHTASGKNITLLSKIFFYINTNLSLYQTLKLYFSEALVHSIPLDLARDSSGGKKRKEKHDQRPERKNSKFSSCKESHRIR